MYDAKFYSLAVLFTIYREELKLEFRFGTLKEYVSCSFNKIFTSVTINELKTKFSVQYRNFYILFCCRNIGILFKEGCHFPKSMT